MHGTITSGVLSPARPRRDLEVRAAERLHPTQRRPIFLAFGGIGQKYTTATPLQMAMVAATIANHGKEMTPHVMQRITDGQGNLVARYHPTVWHTPVSPTTAAAISTLMRSVVTSGTGAGVGFNPADDVAGKTGTAQVGTHNQRTDDWFIAFAPATHPQVAVAVCLPNQPGAGTGAGQAGPIANKLITAALGH